MLNYLNHMDQAKLQLARTPVELPLMRISPVVETIDGFEYQDFELVGYDPQPTIPAPVSV